MSDPSAPQPGDLSFDRVQPVADAASSTPGVRCTVCRTSLRDSYHTANGQPVCGPCRLRLERESTGVSEPGLIAKAALFGTGAAAAGAFIYWAVAYFLNLEIGIVAILTGWMVGTAVRKGAGGRGGRLLQVGAALLVYLSVAAAYVPLAIGEFRKAAAGMADSSGTPGAAARATPAATPNVDSALAAFDSAMRADSIAREVARAEAAQAEQAVASGRRPARAKQAVAAAPARADSATVAGETPTAAAADTPTAVAADTATAVAADSAASGDDVPGGAYLAAGLLALLLFAAALPILVIVGSMPTGLISALILFFGMSQAWKMTGALPIAFQGPFRVGGTTPSAPAEPPAAPDAVG